MNFIVHLKERLGKDLPGKLAHQNMAAYPGRLGSIPPDDARLAAVLLLLFPLENQLHTLLIRRMVQDKDKHSGQISLPGGKVEPSDSDLISCALREAREEVGIVPEEVKILGNLSSLFIPVSGFLVTPVVGYIPFIKTLTAQPEEVAEIITVPISLFSEPVTRQILDTYEFRPGVSLKNVPCFQIPSGVIWGATAMIIEEFLSICSDVQQRS